MPGFYRENSSLSKKVFFTTSTFQKIRPYFDPFQLFSPLDDRFLLQSGKFTPNKEKNVFSSFFNSGQHCGTWDNMPTKGGGDFGETTQLSNTLILRMTFWRKPKHIMDEKSSFSFSFQKTSCSIGGEKEFMTEVMGGKSPILCRIVC